MTFPIHAFVINLERSAERLAAMRQRLGGLSLHWKRVPAVDGYMLDIPNCGAVDAAGYRRLHGKELNPAEAGCYLSHIGVMREFLAGASDFALVLEDDADFPDDFEALLEHLLAVSHKWDIVKLSSFHSGTPIRVAELNAPYALAVPLSRHMNANCVLYNRRAASVLADKLLPMRLPYDHALERAWLFGLKLRVVTPSPCPSDTGLTSTIGDRRHLRMYKPAWHRRFPAMAFRFRTELLRTGFGLIHVLRSIHIARRGQV